MAGFTPINSTVLPGPATVPDFTQHFPATVTNENEKKSYLKEQAMLSNPKGVRLWGFKPSLAHITGLLGFKDTNDFKSWASHIRSPQGILKEWPAYQKEAGDEWPAIIHRILFEIIEDFRDDQVRGLITGPKGMINQEDIPFDPASKRKVRSFHYYRFLHAMHLLILNFPTHFGDDTLSSDEAHKLHTTENWYWALHTIRILNKESRPGRPLAINSNHAAKKGIKPMFFDITAPTEVPRDA